MENQLKQALAYFKGETAYSVLFEFFKKKYQSLGRIGGTVAVTHFSVAELKVLARYFGVPVSALQGKGVISLLDFEKQLSHTRFSGISLKQLLDAYFGEQMISNKELRAEREAKFQAFMSDQRRQYPILEAWFDYLLSIQGEGRWIASLAESDALYFTRLVENLAQALEHLPSAAERLPMFSQRITGNPHAFDLQGDLGKMFLHVLAVYEREDEAEGALVVPGDTEGINELLNAFHLYRDDLLNFVTAAGLYAETTQGLRETWTAAVKQDSVQIIPLKELIPLTRVYPASGRTVWIVENSGVCSVLLDLLPDASIVCTNGQFTLASLMLLDLLAQESCQLYYAGDFDPEGLGMAQRLLQRYPEKLHVWQMDVTAYQQSNPVKPLTKERLRKLRGITESPLIEVASEMQELKMAGYQEALVDVMVRDMLEE